MKKIEIPDVFTAPRSQLIHTYQLMGLVGLSRASITNMVNDGRLPRPRRMGVKTMVWTCGEIADYINALPR